MIRIPNAPDDSCDIHRLSIGELRMNLLDLESKINAARDIPELETLIDWLNAIGAELKYRANEEKQRADVVCVRRVPCWLKFIKGFIVSHRNRSSGECEVAKLLDAVSLCSTKLDNRGHELSLAATRDRNMRVYRGKIEAFIRDLRSLGAPPIVALPHFEYQRGEHVYLRQLHVWWSKDQFWRIDAMSLQKWSEEGVLTVTNQRVIFSSPKHQQVYRIRNIRDFEPCWNISNDQISIASSDRRREYYVMPEPWFASIVISVLWNEIFRDRLMDGTICDAVDYLWSLIGRWVMRDSSLYEKVIDGKTYVDIGEVEKHEGFDAAMRAAEFAGMEGKGICYWGRITG